MTSLSPRRLLTQCDLYLQGGGSTMFLSSVLFGDNFKLIWSTSLYKKIEIFIYLGR